MIKCRYFILTCFNEFENVKTCYDMDGYYVKF